MELIGALVMYHIQSGLALIIAYGLTKLWLRRLS